MSVWIGVLGGIAASTVFYFIEPHLTALDEPWRLVSTGVVFFVCIGLAFFIQSRKDGGENRSASIISDNKVKGNMTAKVEGSDARKASASKVLSDNKVGGDAKFDIKNTKL